MTEQQQPEWEKEFDKRFLFEDCDCAFGAHEVLAGLDEHGRCKGLRQKWNAEHVDDVSIRGVKAFIASTIEAELKKQRAEIVDALNAEYRVHMEDDHYADGLTSAIDIIEDMTGGQE